MREIKFRAWDNEDRSMIDADAWTFGDESAPFVDLVHAAQNEYVLMQYTGLKDKNGVEIYEGDIMRRGDEMPKSLPKGLQNIFTIVFDKGCFTCAEMNGIGLGEGWGVKFVASAYESELEVIGNIYENPELLKK